MIHRKFHGLSLNSTAIGKIMAKHYKNCKKVWFYNLKANGSKQFFLQTYAIILLTETGYILRVILNPNKLTIQPCRAVKERDNNT